MSHSYLVWHHLIVFGWRLPRILLLLQMHRVLLLHLLLMLLLLHLHHHLGGHLGPPHMGVGSHGTHPVVGPHFHLVGSHHLHLLHALLLHHHLLLLRIHHLPHHLTSLHLHLARRRSHLHTKAGTSWSHESVLHLHHGSTRSTLTRGSHHWLR